MFFGATEFFRVKENCAQKLHLVVVKIGANIWVSGISDNIFNIQSFVNYMSVKYWILYQVGVLV